MELFQTMITEALMMGVLNRNVDKNTILGIVGGSLRDHEQDGPETVGEAALERGKELVGAK